MLITRSTANPPSKNEGSLAYVARRTAEGLSKREIMRCLKRHVAREVYRYLKPTDKPFS